MKDLLTHWTDSGQNVVLGLSETWLTASVGVGLLVSTGTKRTGRTGLVRQVVVSFSLYLAASKV